MATNKNATIRYQALNRCFRNPGRQYYIDDLIEACNDSLLDIDPSSSGIKRRQVFDDIKFMRDSQGFDAPIESYKDGQRVYYRYSDMSFSINNQPLNEKEAQQLKEALMTLSRFKGLPQFVWIEEMIARLESSFKLRSNADQVIEFEQNPYLKGLEYISDIYQAILARKTLKIIYQPFAKDPFNFVFHPYYLKQYNNRWFVFGLNEKLNIPTWNLALDRIESIHESSAKYIDNEIDWEEHFEDIIGVTVPVDGRVEEIELIFSKEQANYIYTKPLHPSQRAKYLDSGELQVFLKLIPTYELEMDLLSFGEKVKIIKPDSLKSGILKRLENSLKQYS